MKYLFTFDHINSKLAVKNEFLYKTLMIIKLCMNIEISTHSFALKMHQKNLKVQYLEVQF